MDRLAGNFLSNGDVSNASALYNSLEKLNPTKYSRMARICRVLSNPHGVPLPHRYDDICEALLDPAVPAEVLLRSSAEEVQKTFQRLAVCVHPDKNPNARANDAFLRLTHMKEKALQLLREKGGGGGTPAAAPQRSPKPAAQPPKRPQKPGTHGAATATGPRRAVRHPSPPPLTPLTAAQARPASGPGSLDELRHTTIKLSCFRRKDIADDFEIFSATTRSTAGSDRAAQSAMSLEGDDDEGSERLAATVPSLPRGRRAPVGRRPAPVMRPKSGGRAAAVLPAPLPPTSSDASLTSTSLPVGPSPERSGTPSLRPSPPPLPPLDKKEEAEREGGTEPPVMGSALVSSDAIRQQIDLTCLQLQEMRKHTTNVRLTLDLSFDAYQRSKQGQ